MKTKLLFSLFFTAALSFAQSPIPTFYGADNSSFSLVTSASALDHSATGANQTWNFNQLTALGTEVRTYVAPTSTETSSYPGTTTVIVSNSTVNSATTTSKMYTKNAANVLSITGINGGGLDANFNTNNATLGAFPMNYGFSNSDTVAGNYVYTTYSGTFSGTLVTTVDAYGTLTLNNFGTGAYSGNVTRLKTVLTISLNYSFFTNVGTVTQTSYSYYDSSIVSNNPIFRSVTTAAVVPLMSIDQTDTTLEKFEAIPLNNSSYALGALWIKNPVQNSIEINTPTVLEHESISITDMMGKTVYQSKNETITESFEIPVSLTKGIYLITIGNENGSITKKIVKS
ncbi:T9SS type A sorting domain-containing protein [Flavobacterium sp.]|uniref:T9SS type A sorting domain-containing protein n=1 Tax=Flavobacterium sp. TaxID=239 RepID=UPI002FDA5053